MAYSLVFWRTRAPEDLSPGEVYAALCEGQQVESLDVLNVQPMIDAIQAAFRGCEVHSGEVFWEASSPHQRGFQLIAYDRYVDVNCQRLFDHELNAIIEAGLSIACPLYDPQADTRFDGMPPRVTPKEQKRLERLATPLAATVDDLGWVTCPRCGRRFKATDAAVFVDAVHIKCSQRIALEPRRDQHQ